MNNTRILSAVAVGAAAWLLARYVLHSLPVKQQKRVAKKMTREALNTWEGEGGAVTPAAH